MLYKLCFQIGLALQESAFLLRNFFSLFHNAQQCHSLQIIELDEYALAGGDSWETIIL